MSPAPSAERWPPLLWVLLRLEWRLTMRDFFLAGVKRRKKSPAVAARPSRTGKGRLVWLAVVFVALHIAGAMTLAMPRQWPDNGAARLAALAVLAFLFTWMLSYTMSRIVAAFHERRDLDLLLGAPVDLALILAVRALTIVAATTTTFAFFVFPIVDVGVVAGRWWLARLYMLVPLMALLTTAIALLLTDAVVRLIGVRRARVGLQIFSALIGASMYFVTQARQFLPHAAMAKMTDWFQEIARVDDASSPGTAFVAGVAGLARGEPVPWFTLAVGAFGLFGGAMWWAQRRFVEIAQTPDSSARMVRPPPAIIDRRFAAGFSRGVFGTLLVKEWRLILRAPQLLSQVLLQLLYLMPLMFVAVRRGNSPLEGALSAEWGPAAFAGGIVGLASTLATSLAWLTVVAEDAPDLVAGSPRPRGEILAAKLVAAVLPPAAILVVAAIGIAQKSVSQAAIVFVFGTLACTSAAILSAASPGGGKRSDFQKRHKGRGVSAIVEALQFLLWVAAAGTASSGLWIAAVPLTALGMVMPAIRLPRALRQFDG